MQVIKFHELEDGTQFMFAQTWAYGDNHNCVLIKDSNKVSFAGHNTLVIPVQ